MQGAQPKFPAFVSQVHNEYIILRSDIMKMQLLWLMACMPCYLTQMIQMCLLYARKVEMAKILLHWRWRIKEKKKRPFL